MESLIANLSGKSRRETIGDREYLVAPVTMIVPGVLNGSRGPLLYSTEEIAKNFSAWNNVPLVLGHPSGGGSARIASILQAQGLGMVLNTKIEKGELKGEAWFDVQNTLRLSPGVLNLLRENKPIELSTGLGLDLEPASANAVENGDSYSFIARSLQPDHLAILVGETGACSVQDGCGVLNVKHGKTLEDETFHTHRVFLSNRGDGSTDVVNSHSHFVVQFKVLESAGHEHAISKKNLTTNKKEGDTKMAMTDVERETAVDSLIENDCCWETEDREVLNAFSDEKLTKLTENATKQKEQELVANALTTSFKDVDGNTHTYDEKKKVWNMAKNPKPPVKKKEDKVENQEPKKQTEEEWLASAPAPIREAVEFARNEKAKQKEVLVTRLVANVKDEQEQARLSDRFLKASLSDLQDMVSILPEPKKVANYSGSASPGSVVENRERDFAPFGLPLEYIENEEDK